MVIFKENNFQKVKDITWEDIVKKMENEFLLGTASVHSVNSAAEGSPTIVLHNPNQTQNIFDAVKEIERLWTTTGCHIYVSFAKNAVTFGRHKDNTNVLIVGAIGETSYEFDDGRIYTVKPGDSLYIPAGVYHNPIVRSRRAILSISTKQSPIKSVVV